MDTEPQKLFCRKSKDYLDGVSPIPGDHTRTESIYSGDDVENGYATGHEDGFKEGAKFVREQCNKHLTVLLERLIVSTGEQERAEALKKFIQTCG